MTAEHEATDLDAQNLFDALTADYHNKPGVTVGRIWHNDGLKVNDKIFAMVVRNRLVVKLPKSQASALTASGEAVPFEPRPGRPMKEWIMVDPPSDPADLSRWRQFIAEAYAYVAALTEG